MDALSNYSSDDSDSDTQFNNSDNDTPPFTPPQHISSLFPPSSQTSPPLHPITPPSNTQSPSCRQCNESIENMNDIIYHHYIHFNRICPFCAGTVNRYDKGFGEYPDFSNKEEIFKDIKHHSNLSTHKHLISLYEGPEISRVILKKHYIELKDVKLGKRNRANFEKNYQDLLNYFDSPKKQSAADKYKYKEEQTESNVLEDTDYQELLDTVVFMHLNQVSFGLVKKLMSHAKVLKKYPFHVIKNVEKDIFEKLNEKVPIQKGKINDGEFYFFDILHIIEFYLGQIDVYSFDFDHPMPDYNDSGVRIYSTPSKANKAITVASQFPNYTHIFIDVFIDGFTTGNGSTVAVYGNIVNLKKPRRFLISLFPDKFNIQDALYAIFNQFNDNTIAPIKFNINKNGLMESQEFMVTILKILGDIVGLSKILSIMGHTSRLPCRMCFKDLDSLYTFKTSSPQREHAFTMDFYDRLRQLKAKNITPPKDVLDKFLYTRGLKEEEAIVASIPRIHIYQDTPIDILHNEELGLWKLELGLLFDLFKPPPIRNHPIVQSNIKSLLGCKSFTGGEIRGFIQQDSNQIWISQIYEAGLLSVERFKCFYLHLKYFIQLSKLYFKEDELKQIQDIIIDHHELLISNYELGNNIVNLHYGTHWSDTIRRHGAPTFSSCNPFESINKHIRNIKNYATNSHSFERIFQIQSSRQFLNQVNESQIDPANDEIVTFSKSIKSTNYGFSSLKIKINNILYRIRFGEIVCCQLNNQVIFLKICKIVKEGLYGMKFLDTPKQFMSDTIYILSSEEVYIKFSSIISRCSSIIIGSNRSELSDGPQQRPVNVIQYTLHKQ